MRRLLLVALACTPSRPHPHAATACTDSSRGCLYQTIARETSNLDGFALASYGAAGRAAIDKLRPRKGYDALVIDPAIVLHVDDFLRGASGDPWAARAKYLAAGGTARVYRAVAVNDTIAADIKKHGFLATRLRGAHDVRPVNLVEEAVLHVVAQAGDGDSLISVSKSPAIAKCVAHQYAGDDRKVIVYAIDLPARELIHLEPGSPVCGATPAEGTIDCAAMHPPFSPELRPYLCTSLYDGEVESFVSDQIDPKEIASSDTPADFADCDAVLGEVGTGFSAHLNAARALCK